MIVVNRLRIYTFSNMAHYEDMFSYKSGEEKSGKITSGGLRGHLQREREGDSGLFGKRRGRRAITRARGDGHSPQLGYQRNHNSCRPSRLDREDREPKYRNYAPGGSLLPPTKTRIKGPPPQSVIQAWLPQYDGALVVPWE